MQEIITIYDFLLLPVYLIIFYLVVRQKSKKYESIGLKKIFILAFVFRMFGSLLYSIIIQYYYGYGDTFGYYEGGDVITFLLHRDISSLKYFFYSGREISAAASLAGYDGVIPVTINNSSNLLVMKISAIISFLSFNKYLVISAFFGLFSFIGIWKLFYVFNEINNRRHTKLLAISVLFLPSVWFWGSGLNKESICVGALGISIYLLYKIFIKKKFSFAGVLLMLCMLYILTIVKSYIIIILIISFAIVFVYHFISRIKNIVIRIGVFMILFVTVYIVLYNINFNEIVQDFVNTAVKQIQSLQTSYQLSQDDDERSRATFMLPEVNPSLDNLVSNMPVVITSCLFRPFPWEARKVIIFFSSLEALLMLLSTLYIFTKTYFIGFFKYIFNNNYALFCFTFSLLFALVIGYTTFNFGTMVRYKIIFLPFYFFTLIYVYTKNEEKVKTPSLF